MAIKKLEEILAEKQKSSALNAKKNPAQKTLKQNFQPNNLELYHNEINSQKISQNQKKVNKLPDFYIPKNQYISTPAQLKALSLAQKYDDLKHKLQYLKVCKSVHPAIIEQAEYLVSDAQARKKGALFMWYVKKIRQEWQLAGKNWRTPENPSHKKRPAPKKAGNINLFGEKS